MDGTVIGESQRHTRMSPSLSSFYTRCEPLLSCLSCCVWVWVDMEKEGGVLLSRPSKNFPYIKLRNNTQPPPPVHPKNNSHTNNDNDVAFFRLTLTQT